MAAPATRTAKDVAKELAAADDTDVAIYNGVIGRFFDEEVITKTLGRRRRPNLLLIMVTEGGDPDCAFRIARCLQSKYQRFSLFVSGYCKSAGTLIAIGAHQLVVSDHGELGPLDVQMAKKDELVDRQSGLTVISALDFLREKAYSSFEQIFYDFEEKTGGIVTVQTASKIAVDIVTSIISPIASQVDPLHVGDAARSLRVAEQYGVRLAQSSKSITQAGLLKLLTGYASHGFAIDRREAGTIFTNVRDPEPLELELAEKLGLRARRPHGQRLLAGQSVFEFLSPELQTRPARSGARNAKSTSNQTGQRASVADPGVHVAGSRKSAGRGVQAGADRKKSAAAKGRAARSRGRAGNGLATHL